MITHIVLFKFKPEIPDAATQSQARLATLPAQIDVIRKYELGINIVTSGRAFDLAINSTFDSLADLEIYQKHPKHLEASAFITPMTTQIVAVDYETA